MSIGMLLISVELLIMLCILLFIPGDYAGPCFIGFAIGESLGAAALRVAGGIFTKIADIGADLMKIVFKIKEDDARNPGVIADCTGDNAGDSVGPSADGFETYGVTGVALITFILLAVHEPVGAGPAAGLDLRDAHHDGHRVGGCRYFINEAIAQGQVRRRRQDELTRRRSPRWSGSRRSSRWSLTYVRRYLLIPDLGGDRDAVVEARRRSSPAARWPAHHPRVGQGLHLHQFAPRPRGRHQLARGRRVAQHPLRLRGRATSAPSGWAWRFCCLMGDRLRREHPAASAA